MKTERRNYYLVKYAKGCYMGQEHATIESAIEHITSLLSGNDEYAKRNYSIVHFIETEEEINYPVYI